MLEQHKKNLSLMGHRLKIARVTAGHRSAAAFAKEYGLNRGTYQRHESGKKEASLLTLFRYCKMLNISFVWLLTGVESHAKQPFEYPEIE